MKWRLFKVFLAVVITFLFVFEASAKKRRKITVPLSPMSIVINIPAYRLDLFHETDLIKSYMVGVGMPYFRTVRRHFAMSRLQWNPWWYPPESKWAQGSGSSAPGPKNPLGPVKMILGGSYLVHGTHKPESVGHTSSHGCVRMLPEEAIELAWTLMVTVGTVQPMKTPQEYMAMKGSPLLTFKTHIGAKTIYQRVEIRNNQLMLHPDPYGLQTVTLADVQKVLAEHGFPKEAVSADDFSHLIQLAKDGTISTTITTEARATQ